MFRWRSSLQKTVSFSENERNLHMPCCTCNCHIFFSTLSYNCIMPTNLSASNQILCVRVRQVTHDVLYKIWKKIHLYNITLCFLSRSQYIRLHFSHISRNSPDEFLQFCSYNFLEIGGVSPHPYPMPPGVSALCIIAVIVYTSVF
jgi:hypothetical protein